MHGSRWNHRPGTPYRADRQPADPGLAHPLRLRLLGRLRTDGPATATALAEKLGTNTGATSYHLRQLAEVGLVAEDPDLGTGRQRWWRARHDVSSWAARTSTATPTPPPRPVGGGASRSASWPTTPRAGSPPSSGTRGSGGTPPA